MLRVILVFIIISLIVRAFIIAGSTTTTEKKSTIPDNDTNARKGVPKGIGEYVDFEEIDKKG